MKYLSKNTVSKNTVKIKAVLNDSNMETIQFIKEKIVYFQEIMRNTILSIQNYKKYDIFSNSDVNLGIQCINDLYEKSCDIFHKTNIENSNTVDMKEYTDNLITLLQNIIDKLSSIFCSFGTYQFDDLVYVCIGSRFKNAIHPEIEMQDKIHLIKKYIHPISYKSITGKHSEKHMVLCANKITDDILHIEKSQNYECYDIDTTTPYNKSNFFNRIYGIRVVLQDDTTQKAIVVNGIVDDILVKSITSHYILKRRYTIMNNVKDDESIDKNILSRMIDIMTLKDFLIWGDEDIYKKYWLVIKDATMVKQTKIDELIKQFVEMDIYSQRTMLLNLLVYNIDDEVQYITYMLYDVITANNASSGQNHVIENISDTKDQMLIYDSLPWPAKIQFKDVMKFTVKYTQEMINKYDTNRVSIEQQIYLMKVPEYIKEKAMIKLKEIKGKGDDASSKAKQYLEGLLKIPFGVYSEEPILKMVKNNNADFNKLVQQVNNMKITIPKKIKYTNVELIKYCSILKNNVLDTANTTITTNLCNASSKQLTHIIKYIKTIILQNNIPYKLSVAKECEKNKQNIQYFINTYPQYKPEIYDFITKEYNYPQLNTFITSINKIQDSIKHIETSMNTITSILDKSIHGHEYAKNQILKIIGQWINGEQSGYCFGFEGSPGVGKTSVAKKGLAKCLVDENGISRPFAFIALGGSCNGSTLEGHSYTYVNSIWGRITDILMESKCMNPIIYVDELDKVSKTEHGKEIIGILTHLIDTTQNDCFQDKYYSGINLDLSKALFIFSYNDPDNIDRILLDRIHRVRFDNLTLDDKMIIAKDYILTEINQKMGFSDTVQLNDEIIEYIIETYTLEPGVRKLKEVLFDLFGEINLELLRFTDENISIPLVITIDDL